MSYDSFFSVTFSHFSLTNPELVRLLLSSGWTLDGGGGGIMYDVLDIDGDLEARSAGLEEAEAVLKKFEEESFAGRFFGIDLGWAGSDSTVWLGFNDKNNPPSTIAVGIRFGRRILAAAPPVTDHNWYIDKIVGPLISAGCRVASLKWAEG